jgi:hypothetical protein
MVLPVGCLLVRHSELMPAHIRLVCKVGSVDQRCHFLELVGRFWCLIFSLDCLPLLYSEKPGSMVNVIVGVGVVVIVVVS